LKPILSKLCYWGCIGYQKIPDEVRADKQSDKARIGYFMGYDTDGKGTLVYVPGKKKVIVTGDFIFDELASKEDIENIAYDEEVLDYDRDSDDEIHDEVHEDERETEPMDSYDYDDPEPYYPEPENAPSYTHTEAMPSAVDEPRRKKRVYKSWNESDLINMLQSATSVDHSLLLEDDNSVSNRDICSYINCAIDYLNGTTTMKQSNDELLAGPDKDMWRKANESEYKSFKDKKVFALVQRPPGKKVHKCKIINVIKEKEDGTRRFKTRCVIAGWSLRHGIDYKETFSPTVRHDNLKVVLAIAVQNDLEIHHLDYETAYLNSAMREEVYMKIPSGYDITEEAALLGFDPADPTLCLRLNKSLYGAPQAGRNWNIDVHDHITSLGFKSFTKDPCIYIKRGPDGGLMIICLYVDDVLICTANNKYLRKLKADLNTRYKLNDMGQVTKFLGIRFHQTGNLLELDLEEYIDKMLCKFGLTDCIISPVPAVTSVVLSRAQCPETGEEKREMSAVPYRELVGSLLFATCTIVPEIAAIVSKLAEFMQNPGRIHWHEAKRVLRYLKGIKREKFVFRKCFDESLFVLYGYVDADWATDRDNRRSRAGYVLKIGQSIVSWASILEPTVAMSTAESELMAATLATKQVISIRDLMAFLEHPQTKPTFIFEDNSACIRLSKNSEFHKRTKHIDIRWFFVREKHLSQEVILMKVKSEENVADLFTKVLAQPRFHYLCGRLFEYYVAPT
jgi:hypothetical protein